MIKEYIRKDLRDFTPYHAVSKKYNIKLDANENPYPVSETVLSRLKHWLDTKDNITRYPDTDAHRLRERLAKHHAVNKEEIICTVGSDQLIDLIIKVFVEEKDVVLVPNPSFSMYTLSTVINHGKAVPYQLDSNFDYDYEAIIAAYKIYQPKLVFICTPNNPTGNKASIKGIKHILDVIKCPVIIDEAYEEFSTESMIDYIDDYPQLIILRTFSKAYGIAGLRIGYGISNKTMIDIIGIVKPPYNISSFSQVAAEFILDDIDYYDKKLDDIHNNTEILLCDLKKISIFEKIYETSGNFILAKVKDKGLVEFLSKKGLLVRAFGNLGRLESHIRISVGTKEENKELIQLIKSYQE